VADWPTHPVVHVDHADATAYARWSGKRLPSEPEWEYAAHGPAWRAWPWGNNWDRFLANTAEHWAGTDIHDLHTWRSWWRAHYRLHGPTPATTPVGEFADSGSPFGMLDAAGNVTEWTASRYRLYPGAANCDPGCTAAERLGYLTLRGGSWKCFRWQARTSERIAAVARYSAPDLGFRCAADLAPTADQPSTTTH
jgi:formylglycine-generating enzyme required for sulfatase activity